MPENPNIWPEPLLPAEESAEEADAPVRKALVEIADIQALEERAKAIAAKSSKLAPPFDCTSGEGPDAAP